MKKNRLSLAFLGLLIAASSLRAQDTPQTETAEQKDNVDSENMSAHN